MRAIVARAAVALSGIGLSLLGGVAAHAVTAYGVNANGTLFNFNINTPAITHTLGNLGFVPEGLDFRPGTGRLYAVDVGATTTQLYEVNPTNGAATPIGAGFASTTGSYNLANSNTFGFDFNPRTLQGDGSVRIRLTSVNGVNLRLNSDTGLVANVDTPLAYAGADPNSGSSPAIVGSAYINSAASTLPAAGTTTLFDIDSALNILATQLPPNNGTLNTVGNLGFNAQALVGFDIYSNPAVNNDTIAGDSAYAVFTLSTTLPGPNPFQLYSIDLATGAATQLGAVGGGRDFTGGFALVAGSPVPEPLTGGLAVMSVIALAGLATRRRA